MHKLPRRARQEVLSTISESAVEASRTTKTAPAALIELGPLAGRGAMALRGVRRISVCFRECLERGQEPINFSALLR